MTESLTFFPFFLFLFNSENEQKKMKTKGGEKKDVETALFLISLKWKFYVP